LKNRIFNIYIIAFVVFILISAIVLYFMNVNLIKDTKNINNIFVKSVSLQLLSESLQKNIYSFQIYQKDTSVEAFKKDIFTLKRRLEIIADKIRPYSNQDEIIQSIRTTLKEYSNNFMDYLSLQDNINKQKYYLNIAKSSFLKENKDISGYDFSSEIDKIDLFIYKYLNTYNIQYIQTAKQLYLKLKKTIQNNNGIHKKNKEQLLFQLDEFQRIFVNIAELITKLGINYKSGINGDLHLLQYQLKQKISKLIGRITKIKKRIVQKKRQKLKAIFIIFNLMILLIATYLAIRIIKIFKEIRMKILSIIAEENFEVQDNLFKSELKKLDNFLLIKSNLIETYNISKHKIFDLIDEIHRYLAEIRKRSQDVDWSILNEKSNMNQNILKIINQAIKNSDILIQKSEVNVKRTIELIILIQEKSEIINQQFEIVLKNFKKILKSLKIMRKYI